MFRPYEGLLFQAKEAYRKEGRKLHREEYHNFLTEILAHRMYMGIKYQSGLVSADAMLLLYEMVHYLLSHKVIYVSSAFADKLSTAKMPVYLDQMKLPFQIFEICFEDDFLDGKQFVPSCLVTTMPDGATISAMMEFFDKASLRTMKIINAERQNNGLPAIVNPSISIDKKMIAEAVSLRFRSPFPTKLELGERGICHFVFSSERERGRTIDDVIDNGPKLQGSSPLSEEEMRIQRIVSRVALGVICYLNTSDPDVVPWKDRNRPALGLINPAGQIIGSQLAEKSWFIRSGGPVVLAHERFHRDDQGRIRMIFRKGAEVNKGAKPSIPEPKTTSVE